MESWKFKNAFQSHSNYFHLDAIGRPHSQAPCGCRRGWEISSSLRVATSPAYPGGEVRCCKRRRNRSSGISSCLCHNSPLTLYYRLKYPGKMLNISVQAVRYGKRLYSTRRQKNGVELHYLQQVVRAWGIIANSTVPGDTRLDLNSGSMTQRRVTLQSSPVK